MGFNTNITICNDNLADYERNPVMFTKTVVMGARQRGAEAWWGITVLPPEHADGTQLVAAGGNFATKVFTGWYWGSHHTREGQVALLKQWADSLGYHVCKKASAGVLGGREENQR